MSPLTFVLASLFFSGCGSERTPPPAGTVFPEQAAAPQAAGEPSQDSTAAPGTSTEPDEAIESPVAETASTDEGTADPGKLVPVGPEDARRGSTIQGGGIITEPLKQFFLIQHRLVFINVDKAEQLYEAEHGSMPKSHDEYMLEIIQRNEIELPELGAGWEYYYDATDGELKQRKIG
jgi:hypothetical protein